MPFGEAGIKALRLKHGVSKCFNRIWRRCSDTCPLLSGEAEPKFLAETVEQLLNFGTFHSEDDA
jgi:hypothetical protein